MASGAPPIYTINLSLPPHERYTLVAEAYAPVLRQIPKLYSEVTSQLYLPSFLFHLLGRLLLHRLHSTEHTEELRGISEACGLPMYILIAYNVFLDMLLGCTSGGVRVRKERGRRQTGVEEEEDENQGTTMLHFRTLDWSMPSLRDLIVQFEFVEQEGGEVIARTVGYVGFVGVLTGVRKGLSVSLNFRPYHDEAGFWSMKNLRYYWNTLMIMLGRRPSISALLRECLIPRQAGSKTQRRRLSKTKRPDQGQEKGEERRVLKEISKMLPPHSPTAILIFLPTLPTPAAYLIFTIPNETLILEKDFKSANILRSDTFITTTNHDVAFENPNTTITTTTATNSQTRKHAFLQASMGEILDESIDRKQCLSRKWEAWNQLQVRKTMRGQEAAKGVTLATLRKWIEAYPVCNEVTHFACVMDPSEGVFRWVRKFDEEGEIEDKC